MPGTFPRLARPRNALSRRAPWDSASSAVVLETIQDVVSLVRFGAEGASKTVDVLASWIGHAESLGGPLGYEWSRFVQQRYRAENVNPNGSGFLWSIGIRATTLEESIVDPRSEHNISAGRGSTLSRTEKFSAHGPRPWAFRGSEKNRKDRNVAIPNRQRLRGILGRPRRHGHRHLRLVGHRCADGPRTAHEGRLGEREARFRNLQRPDESLRIEWAKNILTVRGAALPGGSIECWYLEAYCRPDSHTADWSKHTVIGHRTELVRASKDGHEIDLKCTLEDGVIVEHRVRAKKDEIEFELRAHNPTDRASEAHWAQPCLRVGGFTGLGDPKNSRTYEYLKKSFVFLDGKLATMPTKRWATEARYTPGQVWAAPGVPRKDVNPRPLHPDVPSNGLIGCFSGDDRKILAMAWEPYQELFQGVITCLHSDFRIGGLEPGEKKTIRGKIYVVPNDVPALLERYAKDFPEQVARHEKHARRTRKDGPAK